MERQAGDKIDRLEEEKCGVWGRWSGQGGEGGGRRGGAKEKPPLVFQGRQKEKEENRHAGEGKNSDSDRNRQEG